MQKFNLSLLAILIGLTFITLVVCCKIGAPMEVVAFLITTGGGLTGSFSTILYQHRKDDTLQSGNLEAVTKDSSSDTIK